MFAHLPVTKVLIIFFFSVDPFHVVNSLLSHPCIYVILSSPRVAQNPMRALVSSINLFQSSPLVDPFF